MPQVDLIVHALTQSQQMMLGALSDFSDDDIFARPVPAANNVAWQLGHLISAETGMLNEIKPGAMPALPDGFAAKFKKDNAGANDAASLASKAQLLELFGKTRAASIALAKGLKPEELDAPAPEKFQRFARTLGDLLNLCPAHTAMHVGQFQVLRRALGKPVLF